MITEISSYIVWDLLLVPYYCMIKVAADWLNLCWSPLTCSWFPCWFWWREPLCWCVTRWGWHCWRLLLSADASHPPAPSLRSTNWQSDRRTGPSLNHHFTFTVQTHWASVYSQLAVGEALWSLALISLSERNKSFLSVMVLQIHVWQRERC